MKTLIATISLSFLLTGCSLNLKDERIDPAKVQQILQQQGDVINAIVEQIGVLQTRGYLDKPKPEVAPKVEVKKK